MRNHDRQFLLFMLDTARVTVASLDGVTQQQFISDINLRDATVHRIQNLGEAARQISRETRDSHPNIPWAKIIGTRHRVVHEYMSVDYDIIWEIASRRLSELIEQLAAIVDSPE